MSDPVLERIRLATAVDEQAPQRAVQTATRGVSLRSGRDVVLTVMEWPDGTVTVGTCLKEIGDDAGVTRDMAHNDAIRRKQAGVTIQPWRSDA